MSAVPDRDRSDALCEQITLASEAKTPLRIRGGDSKAFYGRETAGEELDMRGHSGVLEYEPSELVIRARSGTPLAAVESLLGEHGQMLPFEPPHFSGAATIGGMVASGLSGPRRPFAGAVRDAMLGAGIINGRGEQLQFGGQVMKNVAGYDLSRLMAGALGTLGVLTEVSLRVLPRPPEETTFVQSCSANEAIDRCTAWGRQPLPLTAACWHDGLLYARIAAGAKHLDHYRQRLGDGHTDASEPLWPALREQRHAFFDRTGPLWRLSVPPATPPLGLEGDWLIDWAGAQRWLYSTEEPGRVRSVAAAVGGHATLFRGGDRSEEIFHPLAPGLMNLHRRLKQSLDPDNILNPGRMYREL